MQINDDGAPAASTTPSASQILTGQPNTKPKAGGLTPSLQPPVHHSAPKKTVSGSTSTPASPVPAPQSGGISQAIAGGGNTHDFAVDVLKGLGLPVTVPNVQAMMAWSQAESRPGQGASFNPMNTTLDLAGATPFNSFGPNGQYHVRNYTSYQQGVQATIQTLKNGKYGPILQALQHGNDAFAVAAAVAASHWGTGHGVLDVLNGGHVQNQPIAGGNSSGGYGPPTGTTGSAATAAGGTGGSNNAPDFDPKAFAAALAAAGFSSHLINSDLGLKQAFQHAVATQQSVEDFQNAIVNTHWFQARTASQRQYDLQNQSDHTSLSRQVQAETASIQAQAVRSGVTVSPLRAHDLAVTAIRNGLTPEELQKSIAAEAHYNPQASYGGTYGDAINKIKASMANYHVTLDDKTLGQFAQQIAAGTMDQTKVDSFLQQQAASKYPWMKPQLDQGFTVDQLASPYKNAIAQDLGVGLDTISASDPLLQRGLQMPDGKGGYTTMPLWQFDQTVKNDPRWLNTPGARDSVLTSAHRVLSDFGLVS